MSTFKLVALALAASATVLLAGCSGLPQKADETAAWTTNKLYSEAQDAMSSKDWTKCSKYFEQVQGRDPFGPHAQQSQLNVAYCNYRDNEQAQANTSIDRFIKLHPDHPDIAYAYYLKGLINFNDDLGLFGRWGGQDMSERDPKALLDSYDSFKTVVDKYPDSKYAPDSAQRMRYIINALAAHEVYSATYYYKRGAYLAAINRAQAAIQQYKNSPATEDALHVMVISYQALGNKQLAEDTQRVLAATFPDSPYVTGRARPGSAAEKPWWQIW